MRTLDDFRFGLRSMRKNPGFTATAVIALALGLGANATVFAIANGLLFRTMPGVDHRILYLSTRNPSHGQPSLGVSWPDFRDWHAQVHSFDALGAYDFKFLSNVSDNSGLPARYNVSAMSANSFAAIEQKPLLGRDFTADDEKPGAPSVAILGYGVWQDRYASDPSALGKTIRINDKPTTVIGVMPKGLRFPLDSDLWTALRPGVDSKNRGSRNLNVFGRLAPGASQRSAIAEMRLIMRNLESAYPSSNSGIEAVVHTQSEELNGPGLTLLVVSLIGAVSFVLLIACANVANLLLARALDRSREISIRIALGAGRRGIIQQLLAESVLLSATGGVLGWLLALWGVQAFRSAVIDRVPVWVDFSMDYRGFAFLAAISLGTGLLFGLAPALRLSRLSVNSNLKEQGRGNSGGSRGKLLTGALVVTEMALAVVLLAGAGLMIRSFLNIYTLKTGVNEKNVLVMRLFLPEARYLHDEDQVAFHERLKSRLDVLPGVQISSIAEFMPTGGSRNQPFEMNGATPVDERARPTAGVEVVSADYFRAMGVKLLRGRGFTERDGAAGSQVAIVNRRFAETFWPDQDPIGKRVRTFDGNRPEAWLTVVGIAPDIVQNLPGANAARPMTTLLYVPYRQKPIRDMALLVRTTVPPNGLATAIRREVASVDENMALFLLRSLEDRLDTNHWAQRVFGTLFASFALIALVLAAVGLFGTVGHSVSRRTPEIGLRMALGASPSQILKLVVTQGTQPLWIGLAIGIAASIGLTRGLAVLLVNVSPTDPLTFTAVCAVLIAAAALGCLIPARRAMRVDPAIALRNE
jgi:putative ABC transport system permease protein